MFSSKHRAILKILFIGTLSRKFAIKPSLKIPPHLASTSLHYLVKYIKCSKLAMFAINTTALEINVAHNFTTFN